MLTNLKKQAHGVKSLKKKKDEKKNHSSKTITICTLSFFPPRTLA